MSTDTTITKTCIVRKNPNPGPTWVAFFCSFDDQGRPSPGHDFRAVWVDCERGSQAWLHAMEAFGLRELERTPRAKEHGTVTKISKVESRRLWNAMYGNGRRG